MTKRYFKITKLLPGNPVHDEKGITDPIEAMKDHLRKTREFNRATTAFAQSLGGKAVRSVGMTRVSLHGVDFESEPERPELWTKPDPKAGFSRRPRAKGARNVKGEEAKAAHKELLRRWEEECPEPLELDEQWVCAGYKVADLMMSGARMTADYEGGGLYVAADQPPTRGVDYAEITGGGYQKVEARAQEQKAEDYL